MVPVEISRAHEREHHPLAERGQEEEGRRHPPCPSPDEETYADDDDAYPDQGHESGEYPEDPGDLLHGWELPVDWEGLAFAVHDVVDVGALPAREVAVEDSEGVQAPIDAEHDEDFPPLPVVGDGIVEGGDGEVAAAEGVRVEGRRDEADEQEQDRQPAVGVQAAHEEARVRGGLVLVVRVYERGVGESQRDLGHVPELRDEGVELEQNARVGWQHLLVYSTIRRAGSVCHGRIASWTIFRLC